MLTPSNQPGQLYGTVKTYKFNNNVDILGDNLRLCRIIAQSDTKTHNAAQIIVSYLKPLCSNNEHIIRIETPNQHTQEFV